MLLETSGECYSWFYVWETSNWSFYSELQNNVVQVHLAKELLFQLRVPPRMCFAFSWHKQYLVAKSWRHQSLPIAQNGTRMVIRTNMQTQQVTDVSPFTLVQQWGHVLMLACSLASGLISICLMTWCIQSSHSCTAMMTHCEDDMYLDTWFDIHMLDEFMYSWLSWLDQNHVK